MRYMLVSPQDAIPALANRTARLLALAGTVLGVSIAVLGSVEAAPMLPEIRVSGANKVPACVTPERLMQFLEQRNPKVNSRYSGIAMLYRQHGETHGVRWDYAFFQMLLETAYLKYGGDDRPKQNNFAGLGTTGGGVRGNSFPDISTGVLAQIQHLVAYSGEPVDKAVAPRTRENQDSIIERSKKLSRPVRFSDLQMRWAMDRRYAEKMRSIADAFYDTHCRGPQAQSQEQHAQSSPAPAPPQAQPSKPQQVAQVAPRPIRLPTPVAVHQGRLTKAADSYMPTSQ